MSLKSKFSAGNRLFLLLFLANGFSNFVQFVASLLLARQLGPEQFGVFSFFVTLAQSLSLFIDLGLCLTMVRLASGKPERNEKNAMIRTTIIVQAVIYVAILVLVLPSSTWFMSVFNQSAEHQAIFYIAVALASVIAVQLILKSIMQVHQQMYLLAGFTGLYAVLRSCFFAAAYFSANEGVKGYFIALYLWPLVISCLIYMGIMFVKRERKPHDKAASHYAAHTVELFHYAKWMLAQPLYTLLFFIPIFTLTRVSSHELGIYSAAFAFSAIFTLINTSIRQVTMPIVSRYTTAAEMNHYIDQVKQKTVLYVVAASVIVLAMGYLMLFVLDERYEPAFPVFCVLGAGMASTIFLGQFNIISHIFRRPDLLMVMTATEAVVLTLLCYITVNLMGLGALGAAISVAVTLFVGEVWLFFKLKTMRNNAELHIPS